VRAYPVYPYEGNGLYRMCEVNGFAKGSRILVAQASACALLPFGCPILNGFCEGWGFSRATQLSTINSQLQTAFLLTLFSPVRLNF